jgi:hypothetical protein
MKLTAIQLISIVAFSFVLFGIIIKLCAFFDIGQDVYGFYLAFFAFIIISLMILPSDYMKLNDESPQPSEPASKKDAPSAPSAPSVPSTPTSKKGESKSKSSIPYNVSSDISSTISSDISSTAKSTGPSSENKSKPQLSKETNLGINFLGTIADLVTSVFIKQT